MSSEKRKADRREIALQTLNDLEACAAQLSDRQLKQMLLASCSRILDNILRENTDRSAA